ncbi:Precorrin-6A reductase [Aquimixticola soesokkakensis]|uniref:Precorrin-6A reductase n=1 Tax=Aquimixticola soesokkakensis TaxID=1519096 RepID=A0A1Y5SNZ9_9RHOB|nr:cobalt-precorrin-6A reductase [Aquimixticola soesokkakensis]SLN41992.1 Precorrin-6A reductase [Aquimixticola soesokkakensis]
MILLLAGTSEARDIATVLAQARTPVVASLAGVTREARPLPVETVVGGFGGTAGFEDFLQARAIHAVVDATHPFARDITARTAAVCARRNLPYLRLARPAWSARTGDVWREVERLEQATVFIPKTARVMAVTGRSTLPAFAAFAPREVLFRVVDPPQDPFPYPGRWLVGRPPLSIEDELRLMRREAVDWLVVKNAGGAGGRAKLEAARVLGVKVALLRMPPVAPDVECASSVAHALDWIGDHL